MEAPQLAYGGRGESLRMIEAASALLGSMHGDGDEDGFVQRGREGLHALGEQDPESRGDGLHAFVLQQIDELAQLAVVPAIGNRLYEGWRRQAAGLAKRRRVFTAGQRRKIGHAEVFAATWAETSWLWGDLGTAGIADRDAGQAQERAAAEGAGAGEQGTR